MSMLLSVTTDQKLKETSTTTHVGHPRCLRGYFVEQDAGDRGKVAGGGGELRQNRLPPRDQRVYDRHGWPVWPQLHQTLNLQRKSNMNQCERKTARQQTASVRNHKLGCIMPCM